ncbi:MAG: magnesium protoporphyrin IX methyltransferase [Rhodothalassiaceae bacterium]
MSQSATYQSRRQELFQYFDRTAADAWAKLTSDAPVSGIRATVRAGRDDMRATLLSWLPDDLAGKTLLDAGCGTGALAVEAARRGARVTAIDLSPTLVGLAEQRLPADVADRIDLRSGDMLDPSLGSFDHIVGMDSLIHYRAPDMVDVISGFAARARASVLVTFAPRTALLTMMHNVGKLFPKSDRAPAIEPVGEGRLRRLVAKRPDLTEWQLGRTRRIARGFYTSQALELVGR